MDWVAYLGPETGIADRVSYVLALGRIRFVLTEGLRPEHPIANTVYRSGNSVHAVALQVGDAKSTYFEAKRRGARIVQQPMEFRDDSGIVRTFAMATCGETVHTFVERSQYRGAFLPGFVAKGNLDKDKGPTTSGCDRIDCITLVAAPGEAGLWADFYENVSSFVKSEGPKVSKRTQTGEEIRFAIEEGPQPGVSRIALTTCNPAAGGLRLATRPEIVVNAGTL